MSSKGFSVTKAVQYAADERSAVKMHPTRMDKTGGREDRFTRREFALITNKANGRKIVRQAMGAAKVPRSYVQEKGDISLSAETLALDYDSLLELGVYSTREGVEIEVSKAKLWHLPGFLWFHPDRSERLIWRFGIFLTVYSAKGDAWALLKTAASLFI